MTDKDKMALLAQFINNPNYEPTWAEYKWLRNSPAVLAVLKKNSPTWNGTKVLDNIAKSMKDRYNNDSYRDIELREESVAIARATDRLLKLSRRDMDFSQTNVMDHPDVQFVTRGLYGWWSASGYGSSTSVAKSTSKEDVR